MQYGKFAEMLKVFVNADLKVTTQDCCKNNDTKISLLFLRISGHRLYSQS